jgi:hypothetical protein
MTLTHATSLRQARAQYFRENGLGEDGGYSKRWVKVQVGPVPMWFPNTDGRRRAVRLHDLHHILTGYDTSWVGEAEIAAWELGSGCGAYYAAWILNAAAVIIGVFIAPRRVWRAFTGGKHTTSLYNLNFDERFLDETVDTVRKRLGILGAERNA